MDVLLGLSYFVAIIFLLLGMLHITIPLVVALLLIDWVRKDKE